ncbi:fibronectin type III domain-containing protein [Cohnella sp.]|uniref:fibronectin type III domain-containing protein n=1 Tax=Cohnella sp. TaxID=1883426 RepID=UPI00356A1999
MKLVSRMGLIIMLLVTFVPVNSMYAAPGDGAPSEYGDNLIVNGTFEEQLEQGSQQRVAHWGVWPPEDTFEVVDITSPPGNRVLKMHTEDIPAQWGVSEAHQWVSMVENQPFALSADIFFEFALNAIVTMRIDFYDQPVPHPDAYISHIFKDVYYNSAAPNKAFNDVDIAGIVPPGTRSSKVEFDIKATQKNAKGTAYVDNVKLQYQWAPTDLRVAARTDTSINLAWDKPLFGDGYQYEVYDDDKGILLGESEDTTFTVEGLEPNTAHTFYVVAKTIDKVSLPSNTLQAATNKPDGTITIMPLGDSITAGVFDGGYVPGGYRGYLSELLQSRDSNAHFVGSLDTNPADIENFDRDHEGHEGFTTTRIATELIDSRVFVYAPDYILFHAGTNDMWNADNKAKDNMKKMLESITTRLPETYVIVASIPGIYQPNVELLPRIQAYNADLKEIVQQLNAAHKKVGFVDMNAMVTEQYFTAPNGDRIHPNADGYKTMAEVWYDALDAVITTGDVAGMFPEAPVMNDPELNTDNTTVQLSWQAGADNIGVDHYQIYQNDIAIPSVTEATYGNITGLAPSTTYNFSVEAVDKAGNRSRSNSVSVVTPDMPDSNPPTAPTDVTAVAVTHDSIKLSWVPGTDDIGIRSYEVNYNGLTTTTVSDAVYSGFDLMGLSPETPYSISLKTIDLAGNMSDGTDPIVVETSAAPPSGLKVKDKSSASITLTWNAAEDKDGIASYRVYMNDLPHVTTEETSYTFNDLIPGQTYVFKVTAVDKHDNETTPTDILSQVMVLLPPVGLADTKTTTNTIDIRWSSVDGATGYKVYVDEVLRTTVSGTEYRIEGLTHNTEYSIAVKSVFGEGLESVISDVIKVKTDMMPEPQGPTGSFAFPVTPADLLEYTETDKGIKLRFVPNIDETKKSLNGTDERLVLSIPSDKPFDMLEVELSGELLKLGADKKKPVDIRMGGLTLELAPGWLNAADKDSVTLMIAARTLEKDESVSKQSLKPLSSAYDFEVQLNGAKVSAFSEPVKLKVSTSSTPSADLSGVYLLDETTGAWTYQGGSIGSGGQVMLELPHFSEYAVFTSVKTFADISTHWALKDIESLAAKQIVFGLTNDQFGPSGEVKRAEFAVMLARAFKLKAVDGKLPFEDVSEQAWYHNGVKAAYQAGWIQGVSETRFDPNARITREQMAVMIMKAYQYAAEGSLTQDDQTEELPFKDAADISDWAVAYVRQAYTQELISGMDGSFKPSLYADRGQAAAMISRLLKLNV